MFRAGSASSVARVVDMVYVLTFYYNTFGKTAQVRAKHSPEMAKRINPNLVMLGRRPDLIKDEEHLNGISILESEFG